MNNNGLVIGIYAGLLYYKPKYQHYYDETNLIYGNIGGADVWVFEIANEFVKQGYRVIVFNDCKRWHYGKNGVEYIPVEYFSYIVKIKKFDIFISNRRIWPFYEQINAKKKILMMHEIFLLDESLNDKGGGIPEFDAIAYQSDTQFDEIVEKYPFLNDKIPIKTNQSIDFGLYDAVNEMEKENSMVWSSHKSRGLKLFVEKVFPEIRSRVPDFILYVCSYINDNQDEYLKQNGIQVISNMPRQKLSILQIKSKIWAYTNIGNKKERPIETFCITAMENAAALNGLILPKNDSFIDIFSGYNGFVDISDNEENIIREYINMSVDYLLNDKDRLKMGLQAKQLIQKYTWQQAAKTFLNF